MMDTGVVNWSNVGPVSAARVSLVVALLVLALKTVAWLLTGSVVLMADAAESVVNVVGAVAALIALGIASQPPDEGHPFGHGKAEYFSAGLEGGLVVVAGVVIVVEAIPRILQPEAVAAVEVGCLVSFVATAINGALGLWLVRRAKALRSPALQADGKHVLADVFTSVGALAGLGLAWATGVWLLDPLFALLVALNVLRVGGVVVWEAVQGLMDAALPTEEVRQVEDIVRSHLHEGALEAHDLMTRRASARVFIEFHLVVPGEMTVSVSHGICDRIEDKLEEAFPGAHITIHVEPESEAHHQTDPALRPVKEPVPGA